MIKFSFLILLNMFAVLILLSSCQKKEEGQKSKSQDSVSVVQKSISQQIAKDTTLSTIESEDATSESEDTTSTSMQQDVIFSFCDSSGRYLIGGGLDSLSSGPYYVIA